MTPKPVAHTNEVSHTSTPWKLDKDMIRKGNEFIAGIYENGVIWHCELEEEKAKANAAFIIRAVNLLTELEKMSKARCICRDSGCLACISNRILKVFEAEAQ